MRVGCLTGWSKFADMPATQEAGLINARQKSVWVKGETLPRLRAVTLLPCQTDTAARLRPGQGATLTRCGSAIFRDRQPPGQHHRPMSGVGGKAEILCSLRALPLLSISDISQHLMLQ